MSLTMQKAVLQLRTMAAPLGYIDSVLDRAAERRIDPSFLDACAARSDACGFYLIGGEMIVLKQTGDGHRSDVSAASAARQLAPSRRAHLPRSAATRPAASGCRLAPDADRSAEDAMRAFMSSICARSRCRAWSRPSICRRSRKPRRCCTGMRGIASARNCGAADQRRRRAAGGAIARNARRSISRAPIRS